MHTIKYFDQPGEQNTLEVIACVKGRILIGDIKYIVFPTTTGKTGNLLLKEFEGTSVNLVAVAMHAGFKGGDHRYMSDNVQRNLEKQGVKVFIGSHSLSGVGRSITKKFGGITPVEIIAQTLKIFSGSGIKVAVEVSVMAADAGLIPTNADCIALGGTHEGLDTAVVMRPAHMNNFFEMEIKEILAKPKNTEKKQE
ncbi:MAG: hypothetical protein JXB49_37060 [Bacteroidales bacterium]|nr:hypothetical protein [Bacteroidales bacterium]